MATNKGQHTPSKLSGSSELFNTSHFTRCNDSVLDIIRSYCKKEIPNQTIDESVSKAMKLPGEIAKNSEMPIKLTKIETNDHNKTSNTICKPKNQTNIHNVNEKKDLDCFEDLRRFSDVRILRKSAKNTGSQYETIYYEDSSKDIDLLDEHSTDHSDTSKGTKDVLNNKDRGSNLLSSALNLSQIVTSKFFKTKRMYENTINTQENSEKHLNASKKPNNGHLANAKHFKENSVNKYEVNNCLHGNMTKNTSRSISATKFASNNSLKPKFIKNSDSLMSKYGLDNQFYQKPPAQNLLSKSCARTEDKCVFTQSPTSKEKYTEHNRAILPENPLFSNENADGPFSKFSDAKSIPKDPINTIKSLDLQTTDTKNLLQNNEMGEMNEKLHKNYEETYKTTNTAQNRAISVPTLQNRKDSYSLFLASQIASMRTTSDNNKTLNSNKKDNRVDSRSQKSDPWTRLKSIAYNTSFDLKKSKSIVKMHQNVQHLQEKPIDSLLSHKFGISNRKNTSENSAEQNNNTVLNKNANTVPLEASISYSPTNAGDVIPKNVQSQGFYPITDKIIADKQYPVERSSQNSKFYQGEGIEPTEKKFIFSERQTIVGSPLKNVQNIHLKRTESATKSIYPQRNAKDDYIMLTKRFKNTFCGENSPNSVEIPNRDAKNQTTSDTSIEKSSSKNVSNAISSNVKLTSNPSLNTNHVSCLNLAKYIKTTEMTPSDAFTSKSDLVDESKFLKERTHDRATVGISKDFEFSKEKEILDKKITKVSFKQSLNPEILHLTDSGSPFFIENDDKNTKTNVNEDILPNNTAHYPNHESRFEVLSEPYCDPLHKNIVNQSRNALENGYACDNPFELSDPENIQIPECVHNTHVQDAKLKNNEKPKEDHKCDDFNTDGLEKQTLQMNCPILSETHFLEQRNLPNRLMQESDKKFDEIDSSSIKMSNFCSKKSQSTSPETRHAVTHEKTVGSLNFFDKESDTKEIYKPSLDIPRHKANSTILKMNLDDYQEGDHEEPYKIPDDFSKPPNSDFEQSRMPRDMLNQGFNKSILFQDVKNTLQAIQICNNLALDCKEKHSCPQNTSKPDCKNCDNPDKIFKNSAQSHNSDTKSHVQGLEKHNCCTKELIDMLFETKKQHQALEIENKRIITEQQITQDALRSANLQLEAQNKCMNAIITELKEQLEFVKMSQIYSAKDSLDNLKNKNSALMLKLSELHTYMKNKEMSYQNAVNSYEQTVQEHKQNIEILQQTIKRLKNYI